MPAGDRTGPFGMGPMTGRGLGFCAGFGAPGFANPFFGRRFFAWGRGRGRGFRNWYYLTGLTGWQRAAYGMPFFGGFNNPYVYPNYGPFAAPNITREQEIDALKAQAEYLESALENIRNRIKDLEADSAK